MARRKSSKKPRRKTAKKVNLIGVAEALVIANVATEGLFNADLKTFMTGRVGANAYTPSNTDNVLTLPELLGIDYSGYSMSAVGQGPQNIAFTSVGAMTKIRENIKVNGLDMTFKLILIPVGFRAVTKLTSKPRASANKLLTYTGLGVKV